MDIQRLQQFSLNAARMSAAINCAADSAQLSTPARIAAFLAQTSHESADFTRFIENLNYSAQSLMAHWPMLFPDSETAERYARRPTDIGNRVYAGRLGNGAETTGDGYRFRGRGLIQITGRDNYMRCSLALFGNQKLIANPGLLETPIYAASSAAWFWRYRGCNGYVDRGDFTGLTRAINGGLNGLDSRLQLFNRALEIFGEH